MTIFVTTGNGRFNPLVREIDRLVGEGKIKDKVVVQIGHGNYRPKHCRWFTFAPSLDNYYRKATLVVSHGGPGTVFEVLRKKKKLIALPNRNRTDPRHQVEYLRAMAQETSALIYCDRVELLEGCLEKAKKHNFAPYQQPRCKMHQVITKFIEKTK